MIGVVLLCAHPRNALYVEKWTFMCSLRGSKMGRWRLFWANFAVLGAMKFPFCVVSARYGPEMRYRVFQGVCWGCSDFFCFAGPPSRAFRTFLLQAGGFYVGLRGCFQERLLCVFTWVTLSPSAKAAPSAQFLPPLARPGISGR